MKIRELTCDVLIVGAGIAGVSAAISASRKGAKTILIEKNSYPGGTAIDCRLQQLCGLYPKNTGIAAEIISGLKKLNPKNKFIRLGKLEVFSFQPENLTNVLRQLTQKEKNLQIYYNATITEVKNTGQSIISLKMITPRQKFKFTPKAVIDASGEGCIIKLSKAASLLAPKTRRQLAGFTFQVCKLRDSSGLLTLKVPYYLTLAAKQKEISPYLRFTNFTYLLRKNSGIIKLNLPAQSYLGQENTTKKYALLIHRHLQKVLPEFKNSQIQWLTKEVHERQGRCLWGKQILTEKDILSAKKFPHAIAKGYWPIEFWHPQKGQQIKYL